MSRISQKLAHEAQYLIFIDKTFVIKFKLNWLIWDLLYVIWQRNEKKCIKWRERLWKETPTAVSTSTITYAKVYNAQGER